MNEKQFDNVAINDAISTIKNNVAYMAEQWDAFDGYEGKFNTVFDVGKALDTIKNAVWDKDSRIGAYERMCDELSKKNNELLRKLEAIEKEINK